MDAATVYRYSADAMQALKTARQETLVSTAREGEPKTVAERVEMLEYQLKELQGLWANCPQSEQDEKEYTHDVRRHELAINHLEQLAKNHLRDLLLMSELVGLGYRQIGNNRAVLEIIPAELWVILHLDYETSDAQGESMSYKAVRFAHKSNLPKTQQSTSKPNKKRPSKRRITKAVEKAREILLNTKKREPTAAEIMSYLVGFTDTDPTGAVVDGDEQKLVWIDQMGKLHDTKRKTIQNMLSKIKAESSNPD